MSQDNYTTWKLYSLTRSQMLRAGIDGVEVALDYKGVIAAIELYVSDENERKQIFEDILLIFAIKQEVDVLVLKCQKSNKVVKRIKND